MCFRNNDFQVIEGDNMNLTELAARALCHGIYVKPADIEFVKNEFRTADDFVSGSVFLLNGVKPINTSVCFLGRHPDSPIFNRYSDDLCFLEHGSFKARVSAIPQPDQILTGRIDGGIAVSDYFNMHSLKTLFISPIRGCIFISEGQGCKFCTYDSGKPKSLATNTVAQVYENIVADLGFHPSVAIGPGTPNLHDHGVSYISAIARKLRDKGCSRISGELVPPHNVNLVSELVDSGCGSIISSIEIWDDASRLRAIPGKSYMSKKHYINFWERAVDKLGRGTASTVFIVGLEQLDTLREGIDFATSLGVVPTLIPYRKYSLSQIDATFTPTLEEYLSISNYNANSMSKNGISPSQQVGCTECGGCSIDMDIIPRRENTEHIAIKSV